MKKTLRSPIDRAAPLIIAAFGCVTALVIVSVGEYRGNEVAVWTIVGVACLIACILWFSTRFSPTANLRVCKTCGIGASPEWDECPKCSEPVGWQTVRTIPLPRESPIPCVRAAARGTNLALVVIIAPIAGLMFLALAIPFAMLIGVAGVAVGIVLKQALGGQALKTLIRNLGAGNGCLCTVCSYPRSDGGSRCPECGLWETEDEARAQWERSGLWNRSPAP